MADSILRMIVLIFCANEITIGKSIKLLDLPSAKSDLLPAEADLLPAEADLTDAQIDLLPLETELLSVKLKLNKLLCELLISLGVLNTECIGADVEWKENGDPLLQALRDILPEQIGLPSELTWSEIRKTVVCDRLLHLCGKKEEETPDWDYSGDLLKCPKEDEGLEWSYTGETGPENWGKLGYEDCDGPMQSPMLINFGYEQRVRVPGLILNGYDKKVKGMILRNTGHAVILQIPGNEQPFLEGGGLDGRFEFVEAEFHFSNTKNGSEHIFIDSEYTVNKNNDLSKAVMEVELKHKRSDGKIVILSVQVRVYDSDEKSYNDKFDAAISPIVDNLNRVTYKGTSTTIDEDFSLAFIFHDKNVLSEVLSFYFYTGSLTSPPCSGDVTWILFHNFLNIYPKQLDEFLKLKRTSRCSKNPDHLYGNVRPRQSVSGRRIQYRPKYYV